jgi:serine/threonine-protein kinase
MSQQSSLVGQTLGQCQIVELIGEGGMANVYKAWQPSLRRYVALKVLAPHLSSDAEFIKRFHQEAVSAANLKHPCIVTIYDVGVESGHHYIAMEFIEGASLQERLRSGQAFAPEQVVDVATQIGSALDYAHQRGFIHRDVKPANVLIEASGRAVLTDFGIVKALTGSGVTAALTQAGTIVGTPQYMSPEQVKDEPLDHRSDLYALGIVCYEMLAGQAPFDGTTTHSILYAQVNNPPPPLRRFTGLNIPPPVEAVVTRMLAKERDSRYNDAGEFSRDLAQAVAGVWPVGLGGGTTVAGGMGTHTAVMGGTPGGMPAATVRQPPGPPTPPPMYPTPPPAYPTPPPMYSTPVPAQAPARHRSRWPLVLGAVAAGLVLILVAVVGGLALVKWYPLYSAQTALAAGDDTKAAEGFGRILERDPGNAEATEGLLQAAANLAQAGQFEAAIAAYEQVQQVKPGEVRALQGLGQAYEAQGEWQQAAEWYEKWTQVAPDDRNAFLALGNARFNLEEYERAVAAYERAMALGAGAVEVGTHLGLAYFELARYDKAVEWLQNAMSQDPEDFQLQRAFGLSLYAQGQTEQAIGYLNKTVALGADRPGDELMDVYYALGGCYFAAQDYEQAIRFYEQAQELDPEGKGVWAAEARANLERAYVENAMKDVLLDLDFSNVVTEVGTMYAVARTGQQVKIEGPVHLVGGVWEGSLALVVEGETTNLCEYPSMEDTSGWGVSRGSILQNSNACGGSYSGEVTYDGSGSPHYALLYRNEILDPVQGAQYTLSAYVRAAIGSVGKTVRIMLQEQGGLQSDEGVYSDIVLTDTWQRVIVTHTINQPDRTALYIYALGDTSASMATGDSFLIDCVQLEQKPYATTYCDGDQGRGYYWNGTPHQSTSKRMATVVSLDDYISLISGKKQLSFRVVARMPYNADATWPSAFDNTLFDARGMDNNDRITLLYRANVDQFWVYINGTYSITSVAQKFSAGDWIDFVVTLDFENDQYALYISGKIEGSTALPSAAPTLANWTVGANYDGSGNHGGFTVSKFVVYDRVLTVSEVMALYRVDMSERNE